MHGGCSGSFSDGLDVLNKVRAMGFSAAMLPIAVEISCQNCGREMTMETCEAACGECGAIHAVTPCHAGDPSAIVCAGVGV
ncbi:MAG: hypothetical protein JRH20_06355 [Deltaproteobacteria bacterium]|nr:hypothetical protein [Deltaproteobacteria bacterium]